MSDVDPAPVREPGESGSPGGASDAIWSRAAGAFARAQDGEPAAMDDLVRLMTPVLWHVVRSYGLEHHLVDDVVQTTWLTLVRRRGDILDPRAVAGWLMTCARREAWRVGRAQKKVFAADDVVIEPRLPTAPSADRLAELSDRDRRLWASIAALDERCRRLLRIVAFEERPDYAGIARDLDMPIGSIGPTRSRCLGKLRTALEKNGWNGDSGVL